MQEQTKEKRLYVKAEAKAAIRADITTLQERARALSKVPARVINGSHQDAVAYKDDLASLRSDRRVAGNPGASLSGRQLIELRTLLEAKLAQVLH